MNLEGSFILCKFSKIIAVGAPMSPIESSIFGSCPDLQYYFLFWNRPQIQLEKKTKQLFTPMTFVSLLYLQVFLTMMIILVVHKVHG